MHRYKQPSIPVEVFGFCNSRADPPIMSVKPAKENEGMGNVGNTEKVRPPDRCRNDWAIYANYI